MKIFIVTENSVYDDNDVGRDSNTISGCFSSEELAKKYLDKLVKNYEENPDYSVHVDEDGDIYAEDWLTKTYFYIEEFELDEGSGE